MKELFKELFKDVDWIPAIVFLGHLIFIPLAYVYFPFVNLIVMNFIRIRDRIDPEFPLTDYEIFSLVLYNILALAFLVYVWYPLAVKVYC